METPSANSAEQSSEETYNDDPPSPAELTSAENEGGGGAGGSTPRRSRCTECWHIVAATIPVASWFLLAVSCISLIFSFFFSAMGDMWLSDMLTLTSAFTFILSVLAFFASLCASRRLGYFY
uniref:Uncharacterized protein n=1 Tax=Odontella aurita TaxID=265563 RepID=A0A7S4K432_9STRA|eukprot:CAMPEP_0113549064 /NCGR_PEP_ID=MMETSP0015_2-20120614/13231_1 /TAXON_ID=2838 /ORGANISM="Odontella" /LENGTH=121 /DNA_ID=CAMNT_0000449743 /DNA_START=216 /DNA_END=584 /DNA_ORIENTATION=+ /assembly_acc=CAM_ASM_000160